MVVVAFLLKFFLWEKFLVAVFYLPHMQGREYAFCVLHLNNLSHLKEISILPFKVNSFHNL